MEIEHIETREVRKEIIHELIFNVNGKEIYVDYTIDGEEGVRGLSSNYEIENTEDLTDEERTQLEEYLDNKIELFEGRDD